MTPFGGSRRWRYSSSMVLVKSYSEVGSALPVTGIDAGPACAGDDFVHDVVEEGSLVSVVSLRGLRSLSIWYSSTQRSKHGYSRHRKS
jgi:hypothetical protein